VQRARELVGDDVAAQIERLSIEIFSKGREYAESRGIIIADTKFEFGIIDGAVILIDEVLTPDSSRFWPVQGYQPGKSQPSFDKQYLRDWLSAQDWDKTPPAPALPQDVITETRNKYAEAYSILTGKTLNL
jgi:phosphoribosylaminoimidazole-succinocarboxamide synthase